MSGVVDACGACLPARSTLMVAIVIPVAAEGELLVGGAAVAVHPASSVPTATTATSHVHKV